MLSLFLSIADLGTFCVLFLCTFLYIFRYNTKYIIQETLLVKVILWGRIIEPYVWNHSGRIHTHPLLTSAVLQIEQLTDCGFFPLKVYVLDDFRLCRGTRLAPRSFNS